MTTITTKDIATRLGLAVSTVGRALADDPRISGQTKARVLRAAEEMGYVGNRAARMMRGASSNTVGLVIPDIRNSFYATIAHELSANMAAHGLQLMLSETADDREAESRHLRELSASRAAAVIIVPTADPHPDTVKLLTALPHVQLLRRHPSLGPAYFGLDDFETVRSATAFLTGQGHNRIGYIGGPVELSTGAERLRGFHTALADAGLPKKAGMTVLGPPASVSHGRTALRRLLGRTTPPTALVTGSVLLTLGVMEELYDSGTTVPDELSVVGFGDEPGFAWWGPGLTTMRLPVATMAADCAHWLVTRLAEKSDDASPCVFLPGELVQRGSTATAVGTRADAAK